MKNNLFITAIYAFGIVVLAPKANAQTGSVALGGAYTTLAQGPAKSTVAPFVLLGVEKNAFGLRIGAQTLRVEEPLPDGKPALNDWRNFFYLRGAILHLSATCKILQKGPVALRVGAGPLWSHSEIDLLDEYTLKPGSDTEVQSTEGKTLARNNWGLGAYADGEIRLYKGLGLYVAGGYHYIPRNAPSLSALDKADSGFAKAGIRLAFGPR